MADDIVLGAKQLLNPKHIKPLLDTDNPPTPKMSGGAHMDISNPPTADFIPREHPLEKVFEKPKTIRHQLGQHVPIVSTN